MLQWFEEILPRLLGCLSLESHVSWLPPPPFSIRSLSIARRSNVGLWLDGWWFCCGLLSSDSITIPFSCVAFFDPIVVSQEGRKEWRRVDGWAATTDTWRDTDGILNLAGGYVLLGVRLMVGMMMIGANMHPRVIVNRGRLVQPSSIYSPALITIASTTTTAEFHGSEGTPRCNYRPLIVL